MKKILSLAVLALFLTGCEAKIGWGGPWWRTGWGHHDGWGHHKGNHKHHHKGHHKGHH